MSASAIRLDRHGPVAELILARPDKRNALTEAMWEAIPSLLEDAAADDTVRVLIVRGEGGAFAAGADIAEFDRVYATPERAEAYSSAIARALDSLAAFASPTLAKIDGVCVGGGCALALSCDLRFAAARSRFAITPGKLGLIYPLGDTRRLIEAVGVGYAKDLLYSGRTIEADEALRIGLIHQRIEDGALDSAVDGYLETMLANSSASARLTKQMIARIRAGRIHEDEESRAMFLEAFQSQDFQEGYRAFLAKRKPEFPRGRR